MDCCSHKTCIEIKTPNCPRCKMFEPTYQELQKKYPGYEYKEYVFGVDPEVQDFVTKYSIRSAPTFIVTNGGDVEVVKQEELEETLVKYADK